MRKIRQRRIKKSYGYVIGMKISDYLCVNFPKDICGDVVIIDQTCIGGELYFLVSYKAAEVNKFFILKVVEVSKYSCVSTKNLIKHKRHFQNPKKWKEKSNIYINDQGVLSVEK